MGEPGKHQKKSMNIWEPLKLPHSSLPPFKDVVVDLGVEKDEEREGDDAEDEEAAPVVVGGVDRVGPELGHLQLGLVVDQLGAVVVHAAVGDGGLEELDDVEEEGDDEHGPDVLDQTLPHRVRIVHGLSKK